MDKRSKIILALFAIVIVGIIITEIARPKPINWKPSYTAADKIPFGGYVLYNELQQLFPKSDISTIEKSLFDVMRERDTAQTSNYIFINDYLDFDKQELNSLLHYVSQGNSVFMAASTLDYKLRDTLNLELEYDYAIVEDTITVDFTNQKLKDRTYKYARGISKAHLVSIDTVNATVLGHLQYEEKNVLTNSTVKVVKKPNFIKTKFGKGTIYVNTTPQAFSNYYLLKDNAAYASGAFSYLEDAKLFYDNYKKSGRVVIDSPMRFVLNQTALKWAYYLTIAGLIIFVVFRAKREQRIIPVVTPLDNSSVEFARTVGSLYYQNKDYTNLITKKIRFFLAELRNRYYLDITQINEKTIAQLASKSGKSVEDCKKLLDFVMYLKNKTLHTEENLIELNKKITAFKS